MDYHVVGVDVVADVEQIGPPIFPAVLNLWWNNDFPHWAKSDKVKESGAEKDDKRIERSQSKTCKVLNSES